MRKYLLFFVVASLLTAPLFGLNAAAISVSADSLIKGSQSTIYYYASDGNRYVFPNDKTFGSWFSDFVNVKTITDEELAQIPLKGNVTYRPGVRMIKIQTVPKVYAIGEGGELRWIESEDLAKKLYGTDWNKKIDDVPDSFFVNYKEGSSIKKVEDYSPATTVEEVKTINKDRGLTESASTPRSNTSVGSSTTPAVPAIPATHDENGTSATPAMPASHATSTPSQTATSTPSGTIPAIPAIPAVPGNGATSTIPAIPATPAVPVTPATSTPPTDITAPIISNIQATNISETSATITWITDEAASSEIYYALSSPISIVVALKMVGGDNVTNHSIGLTSLTASKAYYYVVVSKDGSGNSSTSTEKSFNTLTPPMSYSIYQSPTLNAFSFSSPSAIAYDTNSGDLYIGHNNDRLSEVTTSGIIKASSTAPGGDGIAYDSTTNSLWFVNNTTDTVTNTTLSGETISSFHSPASTPAGIAFNSDNGYLYIVDPNADEIYEVTVNGVLVSHFDTASQGDYSPRGITYNPLDKRLIVLDGDGKIFVYTTNGIKSTEFGWGPFNLGAPYSIELNPSNKHLFLADLSTQRIVEVIPAE